MSRSFYYSARGNINKISRLIKKHTNKIIRQNKFKDLSNGKYSIKCAAKKLKMYKCSIYYSELGSKNFGYSGKQVRI